MTRNDDERRYDLDWLRIALFGLLIFFHIGMFYVPWDWHVKSAHAPVEALTPYMKLSSPWRIPALFVISGIALRFALDKSDHVSRFLGGRVKRLGLPILFGMAVICAPQAYFELRQDGVDPGGLLSFWMGYLAPPWLSPEGWSTITPTWNHLWYVVYVLLLTLVIVGADAIGRGTLRRRLDVFVAWASRIRAALLLAPVTLSLCFMFIFADSLGAVQMVWGDWFRLAHSLVLMLFGFAIARHAPSWAVLWQARWICAGVAVLLGVVLTLANLKVIWVGEAYDFWYYCLRLIFGWAVIFAVLGFVQMIGRGPDRLRRYLSDAVFPYYVLHQTVIIVAGVWLSRFGFSLAVELALLIVCTIAVTMAIHHFVVRRLGWAALLFGGRYDPAG